MRIAVADEKAHFLSPAVLTLDDRGRIGIKSVGPELTMKFQDLMEAHPLLFPGFKRQEKVTPHYGVNARKDAVI